MSGLTANDNMVVRRRTVREGAATIETTRLDYHEISLAPLEGPEYHVPVVSRREIERSPQYFITTYEYSSDNYGDYGSPWRISESGSRTTTVQYPA